MNVQSIGSPASNFYVVSLMPSTEDKAKGSILSGSQGYEFSKWGVPTSAYRTFVFDDMSLNDIELDAKFQSFLAILNTHKPAIILTLGNKLLELLCPQFVTRKKPKSLKQLETFKSSLLSYHSGSLCQSPLLQFNHYIIPTLDVPGVWKQWDRRDEVISIDVARAVDEWKYTKNNHALRPLPEASYDIMLSPTFKDLVQYHDELLASPDPISVDIETIRPKKKSDIFPRHPGFPYTIALARSKTQAISYKFWDYDSAELVIIYRKLQQIFTTKTLIGQNFMSFDVEMLQGLMGFSFNMGNIYDTKLRHHILHPELPHKLQFLCKQYTRQPYYKDEGHGWSPKSKTKLAKLLHYGALDTLVTYEVWEGQELEFAERPWLS